MTYTIDQCLRKTRTWFYHEDGTFAAFITDGNESYYQSFTREDLDNYHPLLAHTVISNITDEDWLDRPMAHGIKVWALLNVLQGAQVNCRTANGVIVRYCQVTRIDSGPPGSQYIWVEGTRVHFDDIDNAGPAIPKLTLQEHGGKTVSRASLDEFHPGWETRLQVAEAMGLRGPERYRYAFVQHTSAELALPSINFE